MLDFAAMKSLGLEGNDLAFVVGFFWEKAVFLGMLLSKWLFLFEEKFFGQML